MNGKVRYPGPPPEAARRALAEAVHAAVCLAQERDGGPAEGTPPGCGRCFDYAIAGAVACSLFTGRPYVPQAGSLYALSSPPDGWMTIDASEGGFTRGEYHCWVVSSGGEAPGASSDGKRLHYAAEWVDFSARHLVALNSRLIPSENVLYQEGNRITYVVNPENAFKPWTAPLPPDYVWHEGRLPPDWLRLVPDEQACRDMMAAFDGKHKERIHRLLKDTAARIKALAQQGGF